MHYVVATVKPWNIDAFHRHTRTLPGRWHLITAPEQLTSELLGSIDPRYLFFPHWSWKVPASITDGYECVGFHMTDVPYGRGGSPLQNLIMNGHRETRLSALRMTDELDAGPVYGKACLSLAGSAQAIFERAAGKVYELIEQIVLNEPTPAPQIGKPTHFVRRSPEQSRLPADNEIQGLYDHIRMLDAEGYPHAFVEHGTWRLLLSDAQLDESGELSAHVRFVSKEGK